MRCAHISDIHWRGIQRHEEYNDVFQNLFKSLRQIEPDIIVNTGDTFHTKTQGITPEVIDRLAWMFRCLADIAPTYTLLGNHDGNLTNPSRKDVITPIHDSIQHPNAHLFRKSGAVALPDGFYLCAFSPFDKQAWSRVKPIEAADGNQDRIVNIALYHGSIAGSEMDNNYRLKDAEAHVAEFQNYDFALLGDIHKHQVISRRMDCHGTSKPWMAYPGSLIQQNFGEDEDKGFLVWDIRSRNDWDMEFHKLPNSRPFRTILWQGSVNKTLENVKKEKGELAFPKGARFRVSSSQAIPSLQARNLTHELKGVRGASSVTFKYDLVSRMDHVQSNDFKVSKKSLRKDPDAVVRLYLDYIRAHRENFDFNKEQLDEAETLIRDYMNKLMLRETDAAANNPSWSIKSFEFDNLFRYGEDNFINFEEHDGVVGIFGRNKIGKSSIVGALMYTLYNTTDRGPMKNSYIINKQKNEGSGKVRINVGGTDYIIERSSQRNIPKRRRSTKTDRDKTTTTLNLWKVEFDELTGKEKKVSMNSVTRDDTDKEIRKLIGTSNDFLLTALSSQGGVDRFIKEGPTERKKILARFLELDIFEKLYTLCKEDHTNLDVKSRSFSPESAEKLIRNTRKAINNLEREIGTLDEKLKKKNQQKEDVSLWLLHHEHNAAQVSITEIEDLEDEIQQLENKQQQKEQELGQLRATITENTKKLKNVRQAKKRIDVEDTRAQLDDYEALRATLHELKHELSTQEATLENQKKNVRKLELVPCGDEYPNCHFIRDGHRDKKKIDKQKKTIDKLTRQYESTEGTLEEYVRKGLQKTIDKWERLDREEFDLNKTLDFDRKNRDYLKTEIRDTKQDIKERKNELEDKQGKVDLIEGKEYENKKSRLADLKSEIGELESARHEKLVELGGKKETLNKYLKDEEESRALIEQLKIYDSILNAFSKNGIPAMVLKSQMPAINSELEKILEGVVDFGVQLSTDVNSNAMDVIIEDSHSSRMIELASGMEKTICSMALRVALLNLSSLPKPDTFIIDEGFGALDEENMTSCMEMLTLLRSYFKNILVISHVVPVKEVADKLIEVKNDGSESKVEAW